MQFIASLQLVQFSTTNAVKYKKVNFSQYSQVYQSYCSLLEPVQSHKASVL